MMLSTSTSIAFEPSNPLAMTRRHIRRKPDRPMRCVTYTVDVCALHMQCALPWHIQRDAEPFSYLIYNQAKWHI
jgi:hypothetical protein